MIMPVVVVFDSEFTPLNASFAAAFPDKPPPSRLIGSFLICADGRTHTVKPQDATSDSSQNHQLDGHTRGRSPK